jgi:hypothetical protein
MAYVTTEQVAELRKQVKATFPSKEGWKFSVTREHYSTFNVELKKIPTCGEILVPENEKYTSINNYHLNYYSKDVKMIFEIINKMIKRIGGVSVGKYHDPMTDYFDYRYYVTFRTRLQ